MMGDPGTSDSELLYPSLGNRQRDEFRVPAPGSALERSEPHFSNRHHREHSLFVSSLRHHPAVSLRSAGFEAWTNREFEGVSVGPRSCAEDPIQSRSSHSEDRSDLVARARVGEDDLLTFPEGEADAVTITARDLASLEPGKFLTDSIVDFYTKYMGVKKISPDHRNRFHFFNSFFFRKLLDTSASTAVAECRVDSLQLRKWVGDVDLFEKDFVFVPVILSSHWSLLVICHLRSLNPSSSGDKKGSPCILHLDPIEGKHGPFEAEVKSFILQEWVKRFDASSNLDILHSLVQMKYIQAKVPQQGNGYDCGLYILHYIEVFLSKSRMHEVIVSSYEGGLYFTRPNFEVEVLNKRNSIQYFVLQLLGWPQVEDGNHLSIEPMLEEKLVLWHFRGYQHQGSPHNVKEMKSQKWREMETSLLLECMVGDDRFKKGDQGAMHWDLIAKEINSKSNGGHLRTKEQCQNRFDTLLKAYKELNAYCLKMGKEFCKVTEDEKRSLKLATPLRKEHEEWYNHICAILQWRSSSRDDSHKRRKLNVDCDMDLKRLASSPIHPLGPCPPPSDMIESSKSMKPSSREVIVEKFNQMEEALKYTFLNLVQFYSLKRQYPYDIYYRAVLSLEGLCRYLAIVQDQNPLEICNHVYQLQELKLVALRVLDVDEYNVEDSWMDKKCVQLLQLGVCKKFGRELMSKNPHLNIFQCLPHIDKINTNLLLVQQIRVLNLYRCQELEDIDLGHFPHLCCLDIMHCPELKVVKGWRVAKGLGWIQISHCPSYCDHLDVQFLTSLKEVHLESCKQYIPWQLANFSPCVQLWRLEICHDNDLVESMDVKALRFLEVLSFPGCRVLSTIHGLSGLQALMKLDVFECESLKVIPDLGCLKALTYLNMEGSGIIEIPGLEELYLLTWLNLSLCTSLQSLPPLGHLKALAYLDLCYTCIEEICGVEDLVSLETLICYSSNLKRLPNLEHLRRLHCIHVDNTPMSRMDPSRSFIGGHELIHNDRKIEGVFLDDVSDISDMNDSEDISSDED